jgi:alpha-mannosidase
MTIRRATLILPCHRIDDFPTHLTGDRALELLAGWTALWHPALIDALGAVPGWRSSDDLPDPSEFDGELLVLPEASRQRMSADWCDRLRATNSRNPPPVEVAASRSETIAAVLKAAGIDGDKVRPEYVGDFLALGHAHLQVELLTRAMRYTTVLDTDQFSSATVAAARAAVAGDEHLMREELARAFDLLADARNHVYAVDFFVVDMTLLAPSTLGDGLRAKLAAGCPTSLLASGELLDQMASEHPQTLAELRRAIEAGTACVVGGTLHSQISSFASPEEWLDEINLGQQVAQRHLQRDYSVFGLFHTSFSPVLPELLVGTSFTGALHASFDGGRLPRTEQSKTWWGPGDGHAIAALAATPLDASRPETWLKLAERIGDTIAHDHVATILLASWPETNIEYFEDLQRAARYGPVLGKLVTLEEYFRVSREPDEWTRFHTREYPARQGTELGANPISSQVDAYRRGVLETHRRLSAGLSAALDLTATEPSEGASPRQIALNAWSFPCTQLIGADPIDFAGSMNSAGADVAKAPTTPYCLPDIPGWGFATCTAAAPTASVALAEGSTLRNERLQVTVSESTGGIQSLRGHRDRNTRVSQRLVFHRGRYASLQDTQMIVEKIEVTRNDALIGEIESRGQLLDPGSELLATFIQRVRIARGMPAVFVDVELEPQRLPEGDIWRSYYASRLAWTDEAAAVRRGGHWMGHETGRERIESPEWVQIDDGIGTITCFGLGLPYHRRSSPNWLDTLLAVAGEDRRRFQFALALDENYPLRTALGLLTAGQARILTLSTEPSSSRGWFLHVGAKNIVATHIEPLIPGETVGGLSEADNGLRLEAASASETPPTNNSIHPGIRIRLLETEGRDTHTTLDAFRPFRAARATDFRGHSTGVLSMVDGRVEFDIGAHRWIQIEAEW